VGVRVHGDIYTHCNASNLGIKNYRDVGFLLHVMILLFWLLPENDEVSALIIYVGRVVINSNSSNLHWVSKS